MTSPVLLTGATGYIGGRLLALLLRRGVPVRCLVRNPEHLVGRVTGRVEIAQGDVLDPPSLARGMAGVETAYYLVHSMGAAGDFTETDRRGARNFAAAASEARLRRIIYLGGLGEEGSELSPHLRSRQEVGEILRGSGIPVIELRASIVIGAGSLSFEMIRALVERLPVMIMPSWVRVPAQPIAIHDLLAFLADALSLPDNGSLTIELGGADVVSYGDLMREYARQRGLRRLMVPVPVLTPRLSSLWLGLVTPVYARVGRKLIDSIRHPTVVRDPRPMSQFPIQPMGMSQAIARALRREEAEFAQVRWSDALSSAGARNWGGTRLGNRLVDSRTITAAAAPQTAFAAIEQIGGETGWYAAAGLWRLRGWLDLLVGGVGMRRGRRHPGRLVTGDVVDCWRVEAIQPGRRLLLAAEMKLPGRAWLEFEITPERGVRDTQIRQTAMFDPHGLVGLGYWYALWPLHQFVFAGMLRGLARAAERLEGA